MNISGQVFIVTGGASGLGEGTARMLVAAGANATINGPFQLDGHAGGGKAKSECGADDMSHVVYPVFGRPPF
jgi:NAD(P)-dependent dehydrogenase (short-subunit alcohol dehydrogenase family)